MLVVRASPVRPSPPGGGAPLPVAPSRAPRRPAAAPRGGTQRRRQPASRVSLLPPRAPPHRFRPPSTTLPYRCYYHVWRWHPRCVLLHAGSRAARSLSSRGGRPGTSPAWPQQRSAQGRGAAAPRPPRRRRGRQPARSARALALYQTTPLAYPRWNAECDIKRGPGAKRQEYKPPAIVAPGTQMNERKLRAPLHSAPSRRGKPPRRPTRRAP